MQQNGPKGRFVRFGSFEADLQEGALTKMGSRIHLQEQPFRILALLVERSGQLVTSSKATAVAVCQAQDAVAGDQTISGSRPASGAWARPA